MRFALKRKRIWVLIVRQVKFYGRNDKENVKNFLSLSTRPNQRSVKSDKCGDSKFFSFQKVLLLLLLLLLSGFMGRIAEISL